MENRSETRVQLRIYYEDTDFSGRVYHASFQRFLERARTEWLRSLGFGHRQVAESDRVLFAVRNLQIEYLAPALMDDLLDVETRVTNIRGASLKFQQRIMRGAKELAKATVLIAAIRDDRPTRIPEALRRAVDPQVRGS